MRANLHRIIIGVPVFEVQFYEGISGGWQWSGPRAFGS